MSTDASAGDETTGPNDAYSTLVEPHDQGGATYDRCRRCGAELLVALGGRDALVHKASCPLRE